MLEIQTPVQSIDTPLTPLRLKARLTGRPAEPGRSRRRYRVRFLRAGRIRGLGNQPGSIEIPASAIQAALAAGQFDGLACFVDHAGWYSYPSLKDLVGVTQQAAWNATAQAAEGVIQLYSSQAAQALAGLLDELLEDTRQKRLPVPDIGLSLVFWPRWEEESRSRRKASEAEAGIRRLAAFKHIESCDFVFEPAAEGRVLEKLSTLFHPSAAQAAHQPIEEVNMPENYLSGRQAPYPAPNLPGGVETQAGGNPAAGNPAASSLGEELPQAFRQAESQHALAAAQASAAWLVAQSGLPQVARERLLQLRFTQPEQISAAIEAERAYLARLREDQVINIGGLAPRSPHIGLGRTGVEQLAAAFEALMSGRRPPEGIQPLTGLRELYHLLSGDFEMNGVYRGDRIYLANVNSSTMANMVANVLNKLVVNEFM